MKQAFILRYLISYISKLLCFQYVLLDNPIIYTILSQKTPGCNIFQTFCKADFCRNVIVMA